MTNPISVANAEHYTWGANCDGWHLVRTPELSVIQERVPPGGRETRHLHTRARQFRNESDRDVVFLVISQPPSQADRQPAQATGA